MNFWDSSALLPLLVREATSEATRAYLDSNPEMALWWATPVECISALARKEREGRLDLGQMIVAQKNLELVTRNSVSIEPSDKVRGTALKLLRRYPLRAADALQLAAAIVLAGDGAHDCGFVCNDARLSLAAAKEGFAIIGFAEVG